MTDPTTTTESITPYGASMRAEVDRARQRRRESTARLARRAEREDARWLRRSLRAAGWLALAALALGALLGASGCCSLSPETARAVESGWASNAGDARDEKLSAKERDKGATNARRFRLVAAELGVSLPPPLPSEAR